MGFWSNLIIRLLFEENIISEVKRVWVFSKRSSLSKKTLSIIESYIKMILFIIRSEPYRRRSRGLARRCRCRRPRRCTARVRPQRSQRPATATSSAFFTRSERNSDFGRRTRTDPTKLRTIHCTTLNFSADHWLFDLSRVWKRAFEKFKIWKWMKIDAVENGPVKVSVAQLLFRW